MTEAIASNCLTSSLTSCGWTPDPAAMALTAATVNHVGVFSFFFRHRINDAEQPFHFLFGVRPLHHLVQLAHSRHQPHEFLHESWFRELGHLCAKVVERKFALFQPLFRLCNLGLIEFRLRRTEHFDNIAHSQDSACHPFGTERFERVELLSSTNKLYRDAGDLFDRQDGTAARVAVKLGENDAIELQCLVKGVGTVYGVLVPSCRQRPGRLDAAEPCDPPA